MTERTALEVKAVCAIVMDMEHGDQHIRNIPIKYFEDPHCRDMLNALKHELPATPATIAIFHVAMEEAHRNPLAPAETYIKALNFPLEEEVTSQPIAQEPLAEVIELPKKQSFIKRILNKLLRRA